MNEGAVRRLLHYLRTKQPKYDGVTGIPLPLRKPENERELIVKP